LLVLVLVLVQGLGLVVVLAVSVETTFQALPIAQAKRAYNQREVKIYSRRSAAVIGKDAKRDCPFCNFADQVYVRCSFHTITFCGENASRTHTCCWREASVGSSCMPLGRSLSYLPS
jgi:hypothetical protein